MQVEQLAERCRALCGECQVAIPDALLRGPTTLQHGISDITAYWRETFDKAPRAAFELVELSRA